ALAAAFVPVALFGPRRILSQFGVVAPVLLIVTIFCTWTEGLIFVPAIQQHMFRNLIGGLVAYAIVAAVLAALAGLLKLPREGEAGPALRSAPMMVLMVAVCGVAYLLYYYVFGGITFFFFTKAYYPQATQETLRLGLWFPGLQFGRGVLMTLALLPVIRTLRVSRAQAAIAVGVLIWVAGGLSPLLVPNAFMGATQRFIHIIEIFTQNASLGVTAALLLRRGPGLKRAESPAVSL
ncbi:MAG: hypothetical protein P8Z30_09845, partial [Acidobacteriota bacterium]